MVKRHRSPQQGTTKRPRVSATATRAPAVTVGAAATSSPTPSACAASAAVGCSASTDVTDASASCRQASTLDEIMQRCAALELQKAEQDPEGYQPQRVQPYPTKAQLAAADAEFHRRFIAPMRGGMIVDEGEVEQSTDSPFVLVMTGFGTNHARREAWMLKNSGPGLKFMYDSANNLFIVSWPGEAHGSGIAAIISSFVNFADSIKGLPAINNRVLRAGTGARRNKREPDARLVPVYPIAGGAAGNPVCYAELEIAHRSSVGLRSLVKEYFSHPETAAVVACKVYSERVDGTYAAAAVLWVRTGGPAHAVTGVFPHTVHCAFDFGTAPAHWLAKANMVDGAAGPVAWTRLVPTRMAGSGLQPFTAQPAAGDWDLVVPSAHALYHVGTATGVPVLTLLAGHPRGGDLVIDLYQVITMIDDELKF